MTTNAAPVLFCLLAVRLLAQSGAATTAELDQQFAADARGQWASGATASSSYGTNGFSPARATGAPDVAQHGDNAKAWATAKPDDGEQWLELTFAKPVLACEVRVRQSFHPGAIARIELLDAAGTTTKVFEGADTTPYAAGGIGWLVCKFAVTAKEVARVRLTLDTKRVAGWNEIDAVQLVAAGDAPAASRPAATAKAVPARSRHDIVLFDVPKGWTRQDGDGEVRLVSPGKDAIIALGHSATLIGKVEDYANEQLELAKKLADYRLETPMRSGEHTVSRGRSAVLAYSHRQAEARDQFCYRGLFCVAAGGRCVAFTLRTDSIPAYEQNRIAFGEFANRVQLTTSLELEKGPPPLTRYLVDETTDFLEWLVHSPMTEAQKDMVEAEARRFWREGMKTEMTGVTEILTARVQLAALAEGPRELARQAVLADALQAWRQDKDSASARMMLAIHDAANAPIAKGEPPLTRLAVEAFAEYLNFAAGQASGSARKLPQATRDALVVKVAEGYGAMSAEQRELITGMPMFWAVLRTGWPDLPKEQQQRLVRAWQQDPQISELGKLLAQQDKPAAPTDRELQDQMIRNMIRNNYNTSMMRSGYGGDHSYLYRW